MNKGTLPIVARLAALQEPAQAAPGGARVIAGLHDVHQLTALVRELNETILARSLRFESSNGSSLTIEVAGRRLLRLTEVNGIGGAEACLAAYALEDEHKDDLTRILQAVAVPRQALRVTSGPVAREADGMSVGIPVALVADLLLVDLNVAPGAETTDTGRREPEGQREGRRVRALPVAAASVEDATPSASAAVHDLGQLRRVRAAQEAPPEPAEMADSEAPIDGLLGRLARGMGPGLMAWLIVGSDEDGLTDGPDEMVAHLKGFLDDEGPSVLRQLNLVAERPGAPVCIVLGATLVDGHSVLCARTGDAILLGVIDGNATPNLIRAWAEAQG